LAKSSQDSVISSAFLKTGCVLTTEPPRISQISTTNSHSLAYGLSTLSRSSTKKEKTMATVSVTKVLDNKSLDPGKEGHWWWNNAHYGKSYFLEVVPIQVGDYQTGYNHTTELEITRQWRKLISTQSQGSIGVDVAVELEIHYIVKNVGSIPAKFNVQLVEIG
jgi:hypothetical protein